MNQSRIILVRPLVVLLAVTCCIIGQTKATSANLSNDWTLPQEGFPVFYRFFRDKISWFEADAVCQFHHGNLVTVNNGIQFDSARAFLRELDVLDTVWIGLKSSAGSSSFNWANSEPLDNNAGYWAESFPSTENPLCAALDPTRSFRWHALNCNGPATAAFLCELPVPAWGSHCTVTAMPSVTIQYLSDVAAIRLSRDCGDEEGERHVLCRAGENRATVLSQLACNHNASLSTEGGDVYATSDESLYTTEEDASTTRSSMESAIDKIVTEIQSIATNDSLNGELEPMKPRKQVLPKKYSPLEKKSQRMQLEKELRLKKSGQKTVTSQVEFATTDRTDSTAPLPMEKKMRPEDLKHSLSSSTGGYVDVVKEERVRRETLNLPFSSTTTQEAVEEETVVTTTTLDDEFIISGNYSGDSDIVSLSNNTTTDEDNDWSLEGFKNSTEEELHNTETSSEGTVTVEITTSGQTKTFTAQPETVGQFATPHTTLPVGAITHPMHISSDMTKELNEGRNKEKSSNNQQDHFVPPMLLVKAKFTPNKPSQQQHVETTEENIKSTVKAVDNPPHTIERPPLLESISNDISKFYPASTEKAVMVEEEEVNKVLVEIPGAVNNISITTKAPPTEEVVTVTSTTTTPTPVSAPVDQQQLDPVQDAESKKYHSEYSFSNIENYQPYRPNRRRALTKSASRSYLRKILG